MNLLPDQPPPTPGMGDLWRELIDSNPTWDAPRTIAMCEERRSVGIARYGTPLQRDNDVDLIQELLDAAVYAYGSGRSSFIARAAVLAATRQSTERRNLERHLEVALAEVDRLTAALAESEAIPLRMIRAAKGGASDYLGGYCDFHLDVFRHGMDTIVSVIETAAKMDPTDYQTRVNVAMGAALTATEKP